MRSFIKNTNCKFINIFNLITSKYFYCCVFILYSFIKTFRITLSFKLPTYLIALYGLFIIIYRILFCRRKFGYISELLPGIFMIVSSILSMIANNAILNSINIQQLLILIIIFFSVLPEDKNLNDNSTYKYLYIFCLFASLLLFLYNIISLFYYIFIDFSAGRPRGMLGELTYFAQSAVANVGLSIYCYIVSENKIIKKIEILNISLSILLLCLTLQRGSIVGFLIAIILLYFFIVKNKIKLKKLSIKIFLSIFISGVLILTLLVLFGKFNLTILFAKLNSGLSYRDIIYRFGFSSMKYHNNYVFGSTRGLIVDQWNEYKNATFDIWKDYLEKSSIIKGCIEQAAIHSSVLEQLFIFGILGLIALCYLYLKILYTLFKNFKLAYDKKDKNIIALIISSLFCLVAVMFDSIFNRALFFDLVYSQNLCFFVFAGSFFHLLNKKNVQ